MTAIFLKSDLHEHLAECYNNELFDANMKKTAFGIDIYLSNMSKANVNLILDGEH